MKRTEAEWEAWVESLMKVIEEQAEKIKGLEARLEKYEKPPKDSGNSSLPPSQDKKRKYPEREKSGKKRGGQLGHTGHHHPFSEPDTIEQIYPETCEHCGCSELQPLETYGEARQEVNLPELKAVVKEYRSCRGLCRRCGEVSRGQFPDPLKAPVQMGASLTPLIGYLKQVHHLSHQRIVSFFADIFQLSVSEGFVENHLEILKDNLSPLYQQIGQAIQGETVVGSDETGQRVEARNRYLWVFQSQSFCYFLGNESRQFSVLEKVIGTSFQGIWVSDRYSAQLKMKCPHQLCLPHLIRNLQYAIEADSETDWAQSLQSLLRKAIHLRKEEAGAFDPVQNQDIFKACEAIRQQMADLFQKRPPQEKEKTESRKLFASLVGRQEQLLLFLKNPAVPYDNNASERALRQPVVHRKVLGGFRSEKGAQRQDVFASLIETAKKQSKNIFNILAQKEALNFA
jgi:transposase